MIAASCDGWLSKQAHSSCTEPGLASEDAKIRIAASGEGGQSGSDTIDEEDDWDDDEWEDVSETLTQSTNAQPCEGEASGGGLATDGAPSYWDTSAFAKNLESVFLATFESGLALDFKTSMHVVVAAVGSTTPGVGDDDLVKQTAAAEDLSRPAPHCSGIECNFASVRADLAQIGRRPRCFSVTTLKELNGMFDNPALARAANCPFVEFLCVVCTHRFV